MLFLLLNWRWLLPTMLLAGSLAWGGWNHIALVNLRAANATALQQATESARAQDAKYAALAQEIEVAHNERAKAIDDAYDANQQLARTRGMYVRVKACVPKSAANSGGVTNGTTEARLADGDGAFLIAFARDCARAADIAVTAHYWAIKLKDNK